MIKERIIQVLEYKNIAKEEFYKKIGVTSANFRGKAKESDIGSIAIAKIFAQIPDVNLEWLLTGNGDMFKSSFQTQSFTASPDENIFKILETFQEALREKDIQIGRLLTVIENLSVNK